MAIGKVTISSIAKLDGWMWDTHVTGFGARRQTNGTFYYVRYRHNGTQTVKSIGRHGPLTPDTARAKAKQLLGTVAGGTDPFAQALSGEGFPAAIDVIWNASAHRLSQTPSERPCATSATIPYPCTPFALRRSTGAKSQPSLATSRLVLAQPTATVPAVLSLPSSLGAFRKG